MDTPPAASVQIIKAPRDLQRRVGFGAIDAITLQRAQEVISASTTDFAPVAHGFLDHLELALMRAYNTDMTHRQRLDSLVQPVMDLKANAGMFRYSLVTTLTNVMLGFLEAIPVLDKDAIEIVSAHHRTLQIIIEKKMSGDGGAMGTTLTHELKDACNRYFAKRGMRPLNIAML